MSRIILPASPQLPGFERSQAQAILDIWQRLRLRINDEIQSGTAAQRPASTGAERFYFSTDEGVMYFDVPVLGWQPVLGGNGGSLGVSDGHGAALSIQTLREALTLTGATTDTSANLLPAGSLILNVSGRVTTAVTGTCSSISCGDPTTGARFAALQNKAQGTTWVGIDQWSGAVTTLAAGPSQNAAAKVRITGNAGTVTGGVVEIIVHAMVFTAPTS